MNVVINIYAPPSQSRNPSDQSKPFAGKGQSPAKSADIDKVLNENVKSAIEQNSSPIVSYNSGGLIESYTNQYNQDILGSPSSQGTHHLMRTMELNTNLFVDSLSTMEIIPNFNVNKRYEIKAKSGDVIEVLIDNSVYYIGYVIDTVFNSDGSSVEYSISFSQFKRRLSDVGYLANLENSGIATSDQVKLNRSVANLIAFCRINTYLSCVPIYTDINSACFFSFYQIADSVSSVLNKLADLFVRFFFQRRNGNVYITQLLGSDAVTRDFNSFDLKVINGVYDETIKYDYSVLPSKIIITYNNDLVVSNSYIAATCEPRFEEYPNKDTLFSNVEAYVWEMPVAISASTVTAYQQFTSIDYQGLFKYDIKFNPRNDKIINQNMAQTFTLLQVLGTSYSRLRSVVDYTIKLIPDNESMSIDIGDTIQNGQTLYTVTSCSVKIDGSNPHISLSLIPLLYTNPIVTVSQSSSTNIDVNSVV